MEDGENDVLARIAALDGGISACELCPRACRVNRKAGEEGFCKTGASPRIASAGPHFGEEAPLVGRHGSGTVFLSGCNLGCLFCQNHGISHGGQGQEITVGALAGVLLSLERMGCHNVNFVSPTHQVHGVAAALEMARRQGLAVPAVYNCGGYESLDVLRRLDGLVEIYMPDAKFSLASSGAAYCGVPDYPEVLFETLIEMQRQVGDLEVVDGVAVSGLLVRHLVMPGGASEGVAIVDFLADHVSSRTAINVMGQYRPCFKAPSTPGIDRRPDPGEIAAVRDHALGRGLRLL